MILFDAILNWASIICLMKCIDEISKLDDNSPFGAKESVANYRIKNCIQVISGNYICF